MDNGIKHARLHTLTVSWSISNTDPFLVLIKRCWSSVFSVRAGAVGNDYAGKHMEYSLHGE